MKVTLHDIAQSLGIATSTVQRALAGNAGVSEKRREEIRRIAAEMGYVPNYHASSLKRGTQRIAVVFPNMIAANRYYAEYLWQGIHQHAAEISSLDLEMVELPYSTPPDDQLKIIRKVARGEYGAIDGLITRGAMNTPELEHELNALHDQGMPIALVLLDTPSQKRFYCIKNYEEMQGRIAADLLIQFGALDQQRKIIVCGNLTGYDQYLNAKGFEQRIWERQLPIDIHKVSYLDDPTKAIATIQRELESSTPVYAIYACSTRSTAVVAELLEKKGAYHDIRTIGSDVFPESVEYLRRGVLQALLNSRPKEMAYRAARTLTSHLRQPGSFATPHTEWMEPSVVLPANVLDG